eukprot:7182125-Prymnesium_polylepis.1
MAAENVQIPPRAHGAHVGKKGWLSGYLTALRLTMSVGMENKHYMPGYMYEWLPKGAKERLSWPW